MKVVFIAFLFLIALPFPLAQAQDVEAEVVITRDSAPNPDLLHLTRIASGFDRPLYVTHAGDGSGRLFVVEQGGRILVMDESARSPRLFLDVSHLISPYALTGEYTELGLLGLAFHPNYASNGSIFIHYTDHDKDVVVARYQVSPQNPDIADAASAQVIFQLPQPSEIHNGGQLAFGPDGYLYIALGDGGPQSDPLGAGQNRQNLLGSILRIDIDGALPYAIPADNPFAGDDGARDEIWSYGFRNPWRFSFDRATGDMYIGDVGFEKWEEVNFQPAASAGGENYGWNVWEGNEAFAGGEAPNYAPPFFVYGHSHGCSVTSGYVYRGAAVEELRGVYLFGDFCNGRIWASWRDHGLNWGVIELMISGIQISSFGEDEAGEIYVVDFRAGALFRIDALTETSIDSATRASAPVAENVKLTEIATHFKRPLYATHAADGSNRLFLVEQVGFIWILEDDARVSRPFLDISSMISPGAITDSFNEQGLLGLAFHPDFRSNGAFFVNYTDLQGSTVVARYQIDADNANIADASSEEIIFRLSQPYANHNGGHIEFGPDGYLYIALGDGGSANDPLGAGQNRQLLLGSILRIDVDSDTPYAIPPDNPFVGDAAARDEIWAYGVRNPWRFSFDRETGDMYFADVGQSAWEEVNYEPAGSGGGLNYGWNVYEGHHIFADGSAANYAPPIFVYSHEHGCSVTGGNVYRGQAVPDLYAVYVFGDWCSGRIWVTWRDRDWQWQALELMNRNMRISSFGEDEAGEVYVIDYGGTLYRFDPASD